MKNDTLKILEYFDGLKSSGSLSDVFIRFRSNKDIDIKGYTSADKLEITKIKIEADLYTKLSRYIKMTNRNRGKLLILSNDGVAYEVGVETDDKGS